MKIKDIKLSPKKNGYGHYSSYTMYIGATEAKDCNLVDCEVVKVIDTENNQIIIKRKDSL